MKKIKRKLCLFSFIVWIAASSDCIASDFYSVAMIRDLPSVNYGVRSANSENSFVLTSGQYETLFRFDQKGEITPLLAESWSFSGRNVLEVRLKPDTFFHDKIALTIDDVIGSFEILRRESPFVANMLSPIKKISRFKNGLKFHFTGSHDVLLQRLAMWFRIYPCSRLCEDGTVNHIALPGTGPLKFFKQAKNSITYEFFKEYHNKRAKLKKKGIVVYSLPTYSLKDLKNIESLVFIEQVSSDLILDTKRATGLDLSLIDLKVSQYGVFNLLKKNSIFHELLVRKALNLSIDRSKLLRLVFKNHGKILSSLSLPGDKGHNIDLVPYKLDISLAKSIVSAKTSTANRSFVVGLQNKTSDTKGFANFLISSAARIGLHGKILENYDIARHGKFSSAVDLVIGSDPSPYGHFEFLVLNFFDRRSPYFMYPDTTSTPALRRVLSGKSIENINKKFEEVDAELHSQYLSIPGIQYFGTIAMGRGFSFPPMLFSLLDLSGVYRGLP